MKINYVTIHNWEPPGEQWWNSVKTRPDEPQIEAAITFTLSWNEYYALLSKGRRDPKTKEASLRNERGP